jgi:matrix metalloproteinase-3 (stromelysin 1)
MNSYKDIDDLRSLFKNLSPLRLRRMFLWSESIDIARMLLGVSFKTEREAIDELITFFKNNEEPKSPVCNCPEPRERRWHKVDQGQPVTWSHNPINQGTSRAGIILQERFAIVQNLCGIEFRQTGFRNADIHIKWAELDGAGGTLGVTYVPGTGDRMSACGPLCGDMIFDTSETWTNDQFFETVTDHEIGHALGLSHSRNRDSLLYPELIALRSWQPEDIEQLLIRYPKNRPA